MNLTPYYSRGVVLTLGTTVVDMRSRLVRCHWWDDLIGLAHLLGADQALPDFDGLEPGLRSRGGLSGRLEVTVDGSWQPDGTRTAGTIGDRRDHMWATLRDLYQVIGSTDLIDVTVHDGATFEGKLRVEDPDRPSTMGWRCDLVLEVSVAEGSLQVAS